MKVGITLLILAFAPELMAQSEIHGVVNDTQGEALIGATVQCKAIRKGTVTDINGRFSLNVALPCTLEVSYLGYTTQTVFVPASSPASLTVRLASAEGRLKEVVVSEAATAKVTPVHPTGVIQLSAKQMHTLPAIGGERDPVKLLQYMPGVQSGSQGSSNMLVRGGQSDQNLYLLDGAPVYNPTHTLGFFSVFNSAVVKQVTLQKGGFDAAYGGRLSSVLDVQTAVPDLNKPHAMVGIGLLSSNLAVSVPVVKNKSGVTIAARRSYIDQVFKLTPHALPAYFYDMNVRLLWKLDKRTLMHAQFYSGNDVLYVDRKSMLHVGSDLNLDFSTRYGNRLASVSIDRFYSAQHNARWQAYASHYQYRLTNSLAQSSLSLQSAISDYGLHHEQQLTFKHSALNYGVDMAYRIFSPVTASAVGVFESMMPAHTAQDKIQFQPAVYATYKKQLSARHSFTTGLRLSAATAGAKVYIKPEPRLSYTLHCNAEQRVSVAYSKMVQYIQLVGSSQVTLPSDLWYPVSGAMQPMQSQQVTLAYNHDRVAKDISFTVEAYYKRMLHLAELKEGTVVELTPDPSSALVEGKGEAYGIEGLLQKQKGKLTGWISYALSYSTRQFDAINNGEPFFARYDRRHVLHITTQYTFSPRIAVAAVWSASSGSRFTPVVGKYLSPSDNMARIEALSIYGKRNSLVLSPAHRLDVNLVIRNKPGRKFETELHVGAYNVYNRVQPFRVTTVKDANGQTAYRQTGLFGFVPSLSFQVKF